MSYMMHFLYLTIHSHRIIDSSVVTQKVQEITLFPEQGCARTVFLSMIRMNFWVVSLLFPNNEHEKREPFLYCALVQKRKENRPKRKERDNDDKNSTLPHPPTPLGLGVRLDRTDRFGSSGY